MNLYIFITHQNNINKCYQRIKSMMSEDFIVIQGGFLKDHYNEESKILELNCNDKYIGLPEKVMKTFHFIMNDERFEKYTHFIKCDDDITVIKKFDVIKGDYLGIPQFTEGDRNYHRGRTESFWDYIPYLGEYKPWCYGGNGYIVSRKALKRIIPNYEYLNHIYEDLYIGILMNRIGIEPKNIDIKKHLISPNH